MTVPVLPEGPPPARLSFIRVLMALLLIAVIGGSAAYAIARRQPAAGAKITTRFAPYVDVTLTPSYAFQNPAANPVQRVILGFVVGDPSSPCVPTWGGYYTLAAAETALNLDQRVKQVQRQGGVAAISFGGEANAELAVNCSNVGALAAAYATVLARYHVSDADFDIEGASLYDAAANARRARAIALVQRRMAAHGHPLRVWLTLPVAPDGLTAAGVAAVRSLLAAHVALAGVNVLAMDFTPTASVRHDMIGTVESALDHTHSQIEAIDELARLRTSSSAAWSQIGVTVMIGRNDPQGEVFSLAAARSLTSFVRSHAIAQASIWSLNRDDECGSVFAQTGVLSNLCSGVTQSPLAFTNIFRTLPGTVTAREGSGTPALTPAPSAPDNAATSPYPIWQASAAYVTGYKVVWHHAVYEATYYSQGQAPDTPPAGQSSTPWLLLGPVLPGESPPKPKLLDYHVRAYWKPQTVYRAGARVLYSGLPFEAKWYSQGVVPNTTLPASSQSPWLPLYTIPGEPAS